MNLRLPKNIWEFLNLLLNRIKKIAPAAAVCSLTLMLALAVKSSSYAAGLSLDVSYNPSVSCGTPTTFTLTATGGSGNYKYHWDALDLYNQAQTERYMVYDPSKMNTDYQVSNTFEFTFYTSGTYYLSFRVMDMNGYETARYFFNLTVNDENYPSVESIVATVAAQCEAVCGTPYEKALWLHDWLLTKCSYDYSFSYCNPEGALARGKGTCEAYTRAYSKLLAAVGIESGRIVGNGHCWNAIKLDGKWYQVDTTWDDNGYAAVGSDSTYMYFCINDELMAKVHDQHAPNTGYESYELDKNYFIMSGRVNNWSGDFTSDIQTKLNAGETSFSLPVGTNRFPYDNYDRTIAYTLVAYSISNSDWSTSDKTVDLAAAYSGGTLYFSASYTDKVVVHTHTWDSGTVTTAPTCNANGEKTFSCTYAGCTKTRTEAITATGHNWDGGTVTRAATAGTTGIRTYNCSKCSDHKLEGIAATGSGAASGIGIYTMEFAVSSDYTVPALWIDGVEVPAVIEDGKIRTELMNTNAKCAVMYSYKSSGAPLGMKVWSLSYNTGSYIATELTGLENLIGYHGFSIRVVEPAGMRVKFSIAQTTKNGLTGAGIDGYKLKEYGTIYMYESNRPVYSFVKGGEKVSSPAVAYGYDAKGIWKNNVLETVDSRERYTMVLTKIPSENYSTELSFRSYMILKDGAGNEITVYSAPVSKSLYSAAKALIQRGDFAPGTSGYTYLNGIIGYVESH